TLKLLMPTVIHRMSSEGGSWYLDQLTSAVRNRLELSNGILVEQHFPDLKALIKEIKRGRFHGIVLLQPQPEAWINELKQVTNVVYAVEFDHHRGVDCVYSNEHRSAVMVLEHLKAHGHENIAWFGILDRYASFQTVGDMADNPTIADIQSVTVHGARHAAWANLAYCQWGGPSYPLILVERDWNEKTLEQAVNEGLDRMFALDNKPTAVVCSCDPVARALVEILEQRGLSVPADMSIITYGGDESVQRMDPPLTSVQMPMQTLGRLIPELVERKLADPEAAPVSVQIEATLWEGKSVAVLA
ncbi:MAG: substrate-binding domain-containing protein, partial [Phycisphaeraceae bacterium JB051]